MPPGDAAAMKWQPKTGLPGAYVQTLQQLPPSRQQQLEKQVSPAEEAWTARGRVLPAWLPASPWPSVCWQAMCLPSI